MTHPDKSASPYDFVVIGSGFGGSVAAHQLSTAGAKVLLLERGPWRDTAPVQAMGIEDRQPLPSGWGSLSNSIRSLSSPWLGKRRLTLNSNGLFDLFHDRAMNIVCSSGVGGGSHVYSAMNVRPAVKDYWAFLGEPESKAMDQHYDWMIRNMGATPPHSEEPIANLTTKQFEDDPHFTAGPTVQQPAMSVHREHPESLRNNSFFGSKNGQKATLDTILLGPALLAGLEIRDLQECLAVIRQGSGYRLDVYDHKQGRHHSIKAKKVILAAGTLNTLRLLFKSRNLGGLHGMPALGWGFYGNGDFIGYWARNVHGANFTEGLPCQGRFALTDYPDCPDLTSYGINGLDQLPVPTPIKRRLRRDSLVVGMGPDELGGQVSWYRHDLKLHYQQSQNPIIQKIINAFNEIAKRSGKPVLYSKHQLLTVHPLGGARCGENPTDSVINEHGEAHDNPGLFICDASALPKAPGSPPSMTIAAWSRHVCQALIPTMKLDQERHCHDTQLHI